MGCAQDEDKEPFYKIQMTPSASQYTGMGELKGGSRLIV